MAVREVVGDACTVCTHSRTEHLRERLACLYVIAEQAGCSCAEFVGCGHGWRGELSACPRCEMDALTDRFSSFLGVFIVAFSAVFTAACIVAWLMM